MVLWKLLESSTLWVPLERFPMATTLTELFTKCLDITSPPNVRLLSTLGDYAKTFNERMALKNLAQVSQLPFSLFLLWPFPFLMPTSYYAPHVLQGNYWIKQNEVKHNRFAQ